uniref:glycoside hydrolase family 13 protein n=1 Tax=Candidatus Enterococcus willemsii TaxID=1857215 RepID=UPI00403F3C8C
MSFIRFNPWREEYKKPFGAIKENDLARLSIEVIAEDVLQVFLVIHKDGRDEQRVLMTEKENNFYSYRYFFNQGKGLYYYHFEIHTKRDNQVAIDYYGASQEGGEGRLFSRPEDTWNFQITCYRQEEKTPDWYREGIFYQIFPDRFYNGNEDKRINSPKPNTFIYASEEDDPLYVKGADGDILRWDFFGGNLQGIIKKIPYLKKLGITGLYLNPIFEACSNHRYDTSDYFKIDPVLGTEEDFKELVEALHQNDIHVILDGVFSHVGQNSRYFNVNGSYGKSEGAYRNRYSPYFSWFNFIDYPDNYESWWGIKDLPEINKNDQEFQRFIFGKENSVLTKWNQLGVDGWRLDVADELPDKFIEGIRKNLDMFDEKVLIGEVWEDASNKISYNVRREYILGEHLQGVMNYPLRAETIALLNEQQRPEAVAKSWTRLYENYPKDVFFNNLNNIGTHDTERILTMLGNHVKKLDLAFGLMFLFPGIPCIYYGDEAGLTGGKDPENRKFFPWNRMNYEIYDHAKRWIDYRKDNRAILEGDLSFFYTDNLFGILRRYENEYVAMLMNPTNYPKKVNGNLKFIAEETPMIQEIQKRLVNRTLNENSYILISSKQKEQSISRLQAITEVTKK